MGTRSAIVAVVALADAASGGGLDDIAWRVLGTYRYAPDDEMTVTRGVTGLIVTAGSGQFLIQPQTRTRFFAKAGGDLRLDFPWSASKPAGRMVLHQSGKRFVYQRVQPAATNHD